MSYGKRLGKALEAAGLTQRQLADAVGISQQAINKLITRDGTGSRYTAQIAKALNVSPDWLATGKQAKEPGADYLPLSKDALEVAAAFMRLSPALKSSVRTLLYSTAASQTVAPWLVVAPPKSDGYDAWERAIEQAYRAEVKQMKLDLEK